MKNIHLFETKNAYDAAKSGLILPRVSYITENKDVKYNPTFDANGHDYVEIAGIKWATMNVGAKSITDYGKYFQWGDTKGYTADQVGDGEGKKKFAMDFSDYTKFTTDGGKTFTKYNSSDKKTVLDLEDDAVHAAWGGSWRMPTAEEFAKLRDAVTTAWTYDYEGMVCSAKTDTSKTLFFPTCGYAFNGSVSDGYDGGDSYYWSSSLDSKDDSVAYTLFISHGDVDWQDGIRRFYGHCVRGVLAEN